MGSPAQYADCRNVGEIRELQRLWSSIKGYMRDVDYQLPDKYGCSQNVICLTRATVLGATLVINDNEAPVFLARDGQLFARYGTNTGCEAGRTRTVCRYVNVNEAMVQLGCYSIKDFFRVLKTAAMGNLRHKEQCARSTVGGLSDSRSYVADIAFGDELTR